MTVSEVAEELDQLDPERIPESNQRSHGDVLASLLDASEVGADHLDARAESFLRHAGRYPKLPDSGAQALKNGSFP